MKKITLILTLLVLVSCATNKPQPVAPVLPKISLPSIRHKPINEGSIYAERGGFFEDHRARQVGDVITIKIIESYQSSMNFSNQLSRSSELDTGISAFLGFEKAVEAHNPRFSSSQMFGGNISSSVDGQGKISRDTSIVATITARVIDVLPNGNLVIQGVRTIRQNENVEYLTVTGIVRPEDIDVDNSVLSTQIADAHIEYSGMGPNAQIMKGPGWLTRILQAIWPF